MSSTVPTRKIGASTVSPIGWGAMGLSAFHGNVILPDEERFKVLDAVYASGCTHWDTADGYGDSEELIGKWFKRSGKRNEIFLATKFGFVFGEPSADGTRSASIRGDPEYVVTALNRSLQRLDVDHIDLWYLHRADQTVPIEHTVAAMAEQVKAGKVKYIGLCEVSPATLRRAHAVHPITALQVEYSPFTLDIEDHKHGLLTVARELGIKIVAYSPVGRGLLAGRFKSPDDLDASDIRRHLPRFSKENFPKVLKIVDQIKAIADKHNTTSGQVTLAWLLAQGDDILPIPGSTQPANINENMAAQKLVLTSEEIKQIRKLADEAEKADIGDRYPPQWATTLMANTPSLE